ATETSRNNNANTHGLSKTDPIIKITKKVPVMVRFIKLFTIQLIDDLHSQECFIHVYIKLHISDQVNRILLINRNCHNLELLKHTLYQFRFMQVVGGEYAGPAFHTFCSYRLFYIICHK